MGKKVESVMGTSGRRRVEKVEIIAPTLENKTIIYIRDRADFQRSLNTLLNHSPLHLGRPILHLYY